MAAGCCFFFLFLKFPQNDSSLKVEVGTEKKIFGVFARLRSLSHGEDAVDVTVEAEDVAGSNLHPLLLDLLLRQLLSDVHHEVEEEGAANHQAHRQHPELPGHLDNDHSRDLKMD